MTEAWLRGPVQGVPTGLMPAAHSILDALEDVERVASALTVDQLWARPGGAPSVGFHLRHMAGSLDRLLTYAQGASLSSTQLSAIPLESEPGEPRPAATELVASLRTAVVQALDRFRATPADTLSEARRVGRAGLPSTVQGLLFHAAEHARRHAGQIVATATILRGLGGADEADPKPDTPWEARLEAALQAYEDAGLRGLCMDGRREAALGAARSVGPRGGE